MTTSTRDLAVAPDPPTARPTSAVVTGVVVVAVAVVLYAIAAWGWDWDIPVHQLIFGCVIGGTTALLAYSLSLVYRANQVVSLAQIPLGILPAFLAVQLTTAEGWGYVPAVALALAVGLGLGAGVHRVVEPRFDEAPRPVAMLVLLAIGIVITGVTVAGIPLFDNFAQQLPEPFDVDWDISGYIFHGTSVLTALVVLAVTCALAAWLRFTRTGSMLTKGPTGADGRHARMVAWALAGGLATIAMLLHAGLLGLPVGSRLAPVLFVSAFAATVIARMRSLVLMLLVSCGLNVAMAVVVWNRGAGARFEPFLFLVLVVGLLVCWRDRDAGSPMRWIGSPSPSTRIAPSDRSRTAWAIAALLIALAALLVLPHLLELSDVNLAAGIALLAMVGASIAALTRWSGAISLGQFGVVGIAAGFAGALNVHEQWGAFESTVVAALAGAAVWVVMGLLGRRVKGQGWSALTVGFGVVVSTYLLDPGEVGYLPNPLVDRVQRRSLLGIDITSERAIYYVCLGGLVLTLLVMWALDRWWREARRPPQDDGAGLGRQLTAFAVAGFVAGVAGGLFVLHQRQVPEALFSPGESLILAAIVVIGGLGSIGGAVLAVVVIKAFDFWVVPELSDDPTWQFAILHAVVGVLAIVVLWRWPRGIGGLLRRGRTRHETAPEPAAT